MNESSVAEVTRRHVGAVATILHDETKGLVSRKDYGPSEESYVEDPKEKAKIEKITKSEAVENEQQGSGNPEAFKPVEPRSEAVLTKPKSGAVAGPPKRHQWQRCVSASRALPPG